MDMYGDGRSSSNQSDTCSSRTTGANGREGLTVLDLHVEAPLHGAVAGIRQNRAVAERSRAELHRTRAHAHDRTRGEQLCDLRGADRRVIQALERTTFRLEQLGDIPGAGLRTKQGAAHRVLPGPIGTLLLAHLVPRPERTAERGAGVAGRRLHPDVVEGTLTQQAAVGHAVERDPAAEHRLALAGELVAVVRHAQHDLLDDVLDRPGQVALAAGDGAVGMPGRAVEEQVEALVRHASPSKEVEVRQVQRERAVVAQVHHSVEDAVPVPRGAEGCEAHQLVLTRVHLEPGRVGER